MVQISRGSLDSPSAAGTLSADNFFANFRTFSLNFSIAQRLSYLIQFISIVPISVWVVLTVKIAAKFTIIRLLLTTSLQQI